MSADEFEAEVHAAHREAVRQGYPPGGRYAAMLQEFGALETCRRLVSAPAVQDGFLKLWEMHLLHLSCEAIAVQPRYAHLFTAPERRAMNERLDAYGFRRPA
jgi:hypothetical protein